MRARSRHAWLTVTVLGTVLAGTSGARPADASRPTVTGSACGDPTGITVIVDFHELGGGVRVGCAAQPVSSGFDALAKAGFEVTNVTRFPGALCRIDGKPSTDCSNMPSSSAYWGYWISARGGSWCYSNQGASRKPPAGTVEGWSFSKDQGSNAAPRPGMAPPAPLPGTTPSTVGRSSCPSEPTTTTTKAPTTTKSTTAPTTPVTSAGTGGTGATTPPRSSTGSSAPAATPTDDGSTTSSENPAEPTTSSAARDGDEADTGDDARAGGTLTVDDRDDGPGSAVGMALGGSAVVLLGGAALVTARRRRAGTDDLED